MQSVHARRLASLALALIALASPFPITLAQPEAPPAKRLFTPAVEKKLAEIVEKISALQRKALGKTLDAEITEIEKVTGLSASAAKPIQEAREKAIGESMELWSVKIDELFRQDLPAAGSQAVQVLTQVMSQIDQLGDGGPMDYLDQMVAGNVHPDETATWKQALAKTLTPSQAAAWEKAKSDRAAAILKQTANLLDSSQDAIRAQYKTAIHQKAASIKTALVLDKPTAARLDSLATAAIQKTMSEWRKRGEKVLLGHDTSPAQASHPHRPVLRARYGDGSA